MQNLAVKNVLAIICTMLPLVFSACSSSVQTDGGNFDVGQYTEEDFDQGISLSQGKAPCCKGCSIQIQRVVQ